VGISWKPISKKMLRNSSRIFMRGCRAPTLGGIPIALKLYGLKDAVFQAPLSPVNPRWNVWKGWLVRLEHFDADIGFLFFDVEREGFTLCDREVVNLFLFDEFAFRQIRKSRGLRVSSRLAHLQKLLSRRIVDRVDLLSGPVSTGTRRFGYLLDKLVVSALSNPFVFERF
jgi:hypothetical protein